MVSSTLETQFEIADPDVTEVIADLQSSDDTNKTEWERYKTDLNKIPEFRNLDVNQRAATVSQFVRRDISRRFDPYKGLAFYKAKNG